MCGLTTEWILESAQSLACALTITWILEERSMPWSGELLIPRSERELRRSEGSGMLIGDPLGEGSSASSTNEELWRAGNSFLRDLTQSSGERRTHPSEGEELRRSAGSGMLIGNPLKVRGVMLALPTASSGERRTHSSEWEGTQTLRRERHAQRWPSRGGEQCWLYQQRALESGELIPQNERELRRSEGSGILIGNPLKVRGVMLALPTASSGERRTHSSEWEGTQTLRRERHTHSRRARKGAVPLSLIGHIQLLISFASVPRQRWVPNRGKQTAAPLSLKRGTGRERSFYIEKAHSARRFPLKDIACVLLAQTKDAKIVCVIGFHITRTRIHTQS